MSNELSLIENTNAIAKVEIDKQVATAKAFPRDIKKCFQEAIEVACFNQEIAQSCMYSKPISKTDKAEGASIRLAEIFLSAWGNMDFRTRTLGISPCGKFISVQATVIDRQTNNTCSETVERSIMTSSKNGNTPRQYSNDMIQNTAAAGASIALRKATLRIIGKHFIDVAYNAACKVATGVQQSTMKDSLPFDTVRQNAVNTFNKNGIPPEKIFNYFEIKALEELTQDHVVTMMGIKNAIREGHLKKDNAFDKAYDNETGELIHTTADDINKKLEAPAPVETPVENPDEAFYA